MEKISALLFMVSAVVFLILFIGQKKKIKQKNYEIEQLKEKNKKEKMWQVLPDVSVLSGVPGRRGIIGSRI